MLAGAPHREKAPVLTVTHQSELMDEVNAGLGDITATLIAGHAADGRAPGVLAVVDP